MRTDLYEKLDFSQIGGREKIDQRCVEMLWREHDIRQFIAERLLYNVKSVYNMQNLVAEIDKSSLYIRHQCETPPSEHLLHRLSRLFQPQEAANDLYDQRYIHLRDKTYRMLIESFFPQRVKHFESTGRIKELDLFDYLQSHFQLANLECTPRHMLLFLRHLRRIAYEYYKDNHDQKDIVLQNGKFHLFHPRHVMEAYYALQSGMCAIFKGCITYKPWQRNIEIFFRKKKHSNTFSAERLKKMLSTTTLLELRRKA